MSRCPRRWTTRFPLRGAIFAAIAPLLVIAPLHASVGDLDDGTFIDGLREEGMVELLQHLADSGELDPIPAQQALINLLRLEYQNWIQRAADGGGEPAIERAVEALNEAIDKYQQLITNHPDHEQRPLWQTDLVELLLGEKLTVVGQNAGEAMEYGVPTAEQRDVFADVVSRAFAQASAADARFFELQGTLPRQEDHVRLRVNTGLWDRMITDYYKRRTTYYLSESALYLAMLPDEAPYFQNLGALPSQAPTVEAERRRLRQLALDRAQRFVDDNQTELDGASMFLGRRLLGRTQVAAGVAARAVGTIEQALRDRRDAGQAIPDLNDLTARMTRIEGLVVEQGLAAAFSDSSDLDRHPVTRESLFLRLLVTDFRHRLLLKAAESTPPEERRAAIARAYQPYLELLERVDPERREAIEGYIFERWDVATPQDADLTELPSVVLMGIAEVARIDGQNLALEAVEGGDEAAMEEAAPRLDRAIAAGTIVAGREDTPPAVAARASLNRGWAMIYLDVFDPQHQIETAQVLAEGAAKYPDQPASEQAMRLAVQGILRDLYTRQPQPPGAEQAYVEYGRLLFDKMPRSSVADDERAFYAFSIYQMRGMYDKAIELYEAIPASHPDFWAARSEMLRAKLAQVDELEAEANRLEGGELRLALQRRTEMLDDIMEIATELRERADEGGGEAEQRQAARGAAILAMAEATSRRGAEYVLSALEMLEGFETRFSAYDGLVIDALSKRLVFLVRAEQYEQIPEQARVLMTNWPDNAAAVLDQVLRELDARIASGRGNAELREAGLAVADLLLDWAGDNGFSGYDLVPFQLPRVRMLRGAGRTAEALAIMQPLYERFGPDAPEGSPIDADVINEMGETLMAAGGRDQLNEAARAFDTLIAALERDPQTKRYPPLWWNAWSRRLQIDDRLGENTRSIPVQVNRLRKLYDDALGGEPFRTRLEELEVKYRLGG